MLTPPPLNAHLQTLIQLAVTEDLGNPPSDKTSELAIPAHQTSTAAIVARKPGVLSGTFLIAPILARYTDAAEVQILTHDGSALAENQHVAKITVPTRALLSAERVLLNFLSHLSGIATLTARYVQAIAHLPKPPQICDTRKTTPAFRALDKYAVRCGGGVNHRMTLYDGVMLKDNHLAALRDQLGENQTLAQLTAHIRKNLDPKIPIWLEVDTLGQLKEALPNGGADIILLDNFTPEQLAQAVQLRNSQAPDLTPQASPHPLLEASGGVTLANLPEIAATGIDRISIGALTHSAPTLDLSMEFA